MQFFKNSLDITQVYRNCLAAICGTMHVKDFTTMERAILHCSMDILITFCSFMTYIHKGLGSFRSKAWLCSRVRYYCRMGVLTCINRGSIIHWNGKQAWTISKPILSIHNYMYLFWVFITWGLQKRNVKCMQTKHKFYPSLTHTTLCQSLGSGLLCTFHHLIKCIR